MFCVQCEHTIRTPQGDAGCSFARGMCGKTSEVSDLQDMLVHLLQAVSTYAVAARKVGIVDAEIDAYVPQAFFSTLTNVNFDDDRVIDFSRRADAYRNDPARVELGRVDLLRYQAEDARDSSPSRFFALMNQYDAALAAWTAKYPAAVAERQAAALEAEAEALLDRVRQFSHFD